MSTKRTGIEPDLRWLMRRTVSTTMRCCVWRGKKNTVFFWGCKLATWSAAATMRRLFCQCPSAQQRDGIRLVQARGCRLESFPTARVLVRRGQKAAWCARAKSNHSRSYLPSCGDPPKGFASKTQVSLGSFIVPRNVGAGHVGLVSQLTGVESGPPGRHRGGVWESVWFWEPRPRGACKTGTSTQRDKAMQDRPVLLDSKGGITKRLYPAFCQFIPSPPVSHHSFLVFAASYR